MQKILCRHARSLCMGVETKLLVGILYKRKTTKSCCNKHSEIQRQNSRYLLPTFLNNRMFLTVYLLSFTDLMLLCRVLILNHCSHLTLMACMQSHIYHYSHLIVLAATNLFCLLFFDSDYKDGSLCASLER